MNNREEAASFTDSKSLTSKIKEVARHLGFFKTGVVRPRPLPAGDRFDSWLRNGMHGEMGYMERQSARRHNPALVLEDARSLLVCAMNYHAGKTPTDDASRARISSYAWGDDYHTVVKDRLEQLLDFVQRERPECRAICYVDTGPVMEKVWGAETALGWIGKHTNLISREQGSWFFIGVILLDLELEYDAKEADHCGTCTRCIRACPTGAIVAPYVLDARLCISYLTIELRGAIPRRLRPLIGNRVYGCDDCQDVCPWNRFAVKTDEAAFRPRTVNLMPELASLVDVSVDEFNRRFKNSPIRRAKRDGFVRNVVVALGNSRSPQALDPLSHAILDPSPLVRCHAAWALGQIDSREARRILHEARSSESSPEVLEEIDLSLQTTGISSES